MYLARKMAKQPTVLVTNAAAYLQSFFVSRIIHHMASNHRHCGTHCLVICANVNKNVVASLEKFLLCYPARAARAGLSDRVWCIYIYNRKKIY